jgi:hypothetical protein
MESNIVDDDIARDIRTGSSESLNPSRRLSYVSQVHDQWYKLRGKRLGLKYNAENIRHSTELLEADLKQVVVACKGLLVKQLAKRPTPASHRSSSVLATLSN